jgi:hypothetical protein
VVFTTNRKKKNKILNFLKNFLFKKIQYVKKCDFFLDKKIDQKIFQKSLHIYSNINLFISINIIYIHAKKEVILSNISFNL